MAGETIPVSEPRVRGGCPDWGASRPGEIGRPCPRSGHGCSPRRQVIPPRLRETGPHGTKPCTPANLQRAVSRPTVCVVVNHVPCPRRTYTLTAAPWRDPAGNHADPGALIQHAIRTAAFTFTILARAVRVDNAYAGANHGVQALLRQALTARGDIDPSDGTFTMKLDPTRAGPVTAASTQLFEHLNSAQTRHVGTHRNRAAKPSPQ